MPFILFNINVKIRFKPNSDSSMNGQFYITGGSK